MNGLPELAARLLARHGAEIFEDAALLKTALKKDAPELGRLEKTAFLSLCKNGAAVELKSANEKERPYTKAYLAQKLYDETALPLPVCNGVFDAIEAVLFSAPENAPEEAMLPALETGGETGAAKTRASKGNWTVRLLSIALVVIVIVLVVLTTILVKRIKDAKQEDAEITTEQAPPVSAPEEEPDPIGEPAPSGDQDKTENQNEQQPENEAAKSDNADSDNKEEDANKGGSQ